jgi:hypothetical protein
MAHYCCAVLVQKVRTEVFLSFCIPGTRLKDQYCLVPSLEERFFLVPILLSFLLILFWLVFWIFPSVNFCYPFNRIGVLGVSFEFLFIYSLVRHFE